MKNLLAGRVCVGRQHQIYPLAIYFSMQLLVLCDCADLTFDLLSPAVPRGGFALPSPMAVSQSSGHHRALSAVTLNLHAYDLRRRGEVRALHDECEQIHRLKQITPEKRVSKIPADEASRTHGREVHASANVCKYL